MDNNGKNNTKNNGNSRKSGRVLTSGCEAARQAMTALEKQSASKRWSFGRANVTLHLMPCAARAENASGIQSIPAIHGYGGHGADLADRRVTPGGLD
jgi:hypothetical protein